MTSRRAVTPEERINAAHADIVELLTRGCTRQALWRARNATEAELAIRDRNNPAAADLLYAAYTGALLATASTLATQQPLNPPGYHGGPPTTADLIHVFDMAHAITLNQPRN